MIHLDTQSAIANMAGLESLYRQALEIFLDESSKLLSDAMQACQQQDWPLARRAAHSLKSSGALIGAAPLSQLAGQLEQLCLASETQQNAAEPLSTTLDALQQEWRMLEPLLKAYQQAG